jgi:arylsulfatase A-like enzyme
VTAPGHAVPAHPDRGRPNILLIVTDQQQYANAGPAAPERSPCLAALAAQGAWFRRGYTVTTPCSPSRASLVTGVYPHRHGMLNNCTMPFAVSREIAAGCDSWGRRLMDAGYRMRFVGRWHAGVERGPVEYGFDTEYRIFDSARYLRQLGLSEPPDSEVWEFVDVGGRPWPQYGRQRGPVEASATAMQAQATIEALRDVTRAHGGGASDAPWCIWTNFTGPHSPFVIPEPYASMYDWRDVPLPASFDDPCEDKPAYVRRTRQSWFGQIDEVHARKTIAHYWGFCTLVDHYVGSVLDCLEACGAAENTLVAFTSDHGEMLGAHGLWHKDAYAYEETHRLPFIMRWPGVIPQGTVVDAFARTVDLGPTFVEATGAAPIDPCHGTSLLPLLAGVPGAGEALERRELLIEEHGNFFNFTIRALSDGHFKLTWNANDFDELYHLEADPHEIHNLAGCPEHAATYRRMCDRLWEWMERLDDPYAGPRFGASVSLPRSS